MSKTFTHTKKQAQQTHARHRAKERYDVELNKDARHEIVSKIQESLKSNINIQKSLKASRQVPETPISATFLTKQSNRITEWEVPFEGQDLRVLYDGKRKTLVSCLPPLKKDNE
jgi:hypothetical protein